jgi:hypothetical protein
VIIDYGFMDISHFNDYKSRWTKYNNIVLDIHYYHAFGQFWNDMASTQDTRVKSWDVHKKMACEFSNKMLKTGRFEVMYYFVHTIIVFLLPNINIEKLYQFVLNLIIESIE